MKPLIHALLMHRSHNGVKKAWIPLPLPDNFEKVSLLTYRLGIDETPDDEHSEYDEVIAYRSALGVTPDAETELLDVEVTADNLRKLTPKQFEALKSLLTAFDFGFDAIDRVLSYLSLIKTYEQFKKLQKQRKRR